MLLTVLILEVLSTVSGCWVWL